jgi:hypothetical protein
LQEPPTHFQLDGLMARVMDQDVLPVLLALRALRRTFGSGEQPSYAWPGVEFDISGRKTDVDLLFYAGGPVICCECKRNAATLTDDQLDGIIGLCERLRCRPALAAAENEFADTQCERVLAADGVVLHATELLAH